MLNKSICEGVCIYLNYFFDLWFEELIYVLSWNRYVFSWNGYLLYFFNICVDCKYWFKIGGFF